MENNFKFVIFYDDGTWYESYEPCSLDDALKEVGDSDNCKISTEIGDVDVFEDGEWLMPREEAEALAASEITAEAEKKAAKEAARRAELATFGDAEDEANIAFIKSICQKRPARDYAGRDSAREISTYPGWKHTVSYNGDGYVEKNGRQYKIVMWRGQTNITRLETK